MPRWTYVVVPLIAVALLVWPRVRPIATPIFESAPPDVMPPWHGALERDLPLTLEDSERGRSVARAVAQLLRGRDDEIDEAANALAACIGDESDAIAWHAATCLAAALMDRRTQLPHAVSTALVRGLAIRPRRLPESETDLIAAWEPLLREALGPGTVWSPHRR